MNTSLLPFQLVYKEMCKWPKYGLHLHFTIKELGKVMNINPCFSSNYADKLVSFIDTWHEQLQLI
jgi:hypothetical protein